MRRILFCLIAAFIGLFVLSLHPARAQAWQSGATGDLLFQTSAFMQSQSYAKPDGIADQMSDSGAYSPLNQTWDRTHEGKWRIEEQRYGFAAFVAGILYHRQDLIDRGRKIMDWGFAQEQPDGSFACGDNFHSSQFFIESAAHAALLLQASSMAPQNQAWINSIKPQLRKAAYWLIDPQNDIPGKKHDAPYTHRRYLAAAAIGETGVLTGDTKLIERSRQYIAEGISLQTSEGVNPEKSGSDTNYQAVGLSFALSYYTLVADDADRRALAPMIEHGLGWLRSRMRPDGTLDQSENTRTGLGQERGPNGTLKYMSYKTAADAAAYWAMIQENKAWMEFAKKLCEGEKVELAERKENK